MIRTFLEIIGAVYGLALVFQLVLAPPPLVVTGAGVPHEAYSPGDPFYIAYVGTQGWWARQFCEQVASELVIIDADNQPFRQPLQDGFNLTQHPVALPLTLAPGAAQAYEHVTYECMGWVPVHVRAPAVDIWIIALEKNEGY